jgi:AraC-like DNA-binding protein
VSDTLIVLDMFTRGLAVGATVVLGLAVWRSGVGRSVQLSTVMVTASVVAWLICESRPLWSVTDYFLPLLFLSFPVGGLFWQFVITVFEDRPVSPATLAPSVLLMGTGLTMQVLGKPIGDEVWFAHNGISGLLAIHAGVVIARGWGGDLLEGRRRLRGIVLGFAAAFSLSSVVLGYAARLDPQGPWIEFTAGHPYGGMIFAALMVAAATVFLQARAAVFGAPRRSNQASDGRAETAERLLLGKLNDFMAAGGWRREGLTIGAVGEALAESEHRVRRLINQRLGHRNFADFVNSYRIDAAKARLADPGEARTTVAAIAFDLGYGSLGPFNRAFRAATDATPTEWRRQALADGSSELKEAI